jgi:hypothetical protein
LNLPEKSLSDAGCLASFIDGREAERLGCELYPERVVVAKAGVGGAYLGGAGDVAEDLVQLVFCPGGLIVIKFLRQTKSV